jgi:hypothetical protein
MKRNLCLTKHMVMTSIMFTAICFSCNQERKEVSTPQADLYEKSGINEGDSLVKNLVDLKGLYRLQPEDKTFSVDIKVEFKDDNNSDWITNINGNIDRIPKKYRIFADALYVTHDLEKFNTVIEEQRKKGQEMAATIAEEMISKIPAVDKYRIELTDSDTIKLYGSRVNFDLIKIK